MDTVIPAIVAVLTEDERRDVAVSREKTGHGTVERVAGDGFKIEVRPLGAYGWADDWMLAVTLATVASRGIGKRHRVYWSYNGAAWMIRRAFVLTGPVVESSNPDGELHWIKRRMTEAGRA